MKSKFNFYPLDKQKTKDLFINKLGSWLLSKQHDDVFVNAYVGLHCTNQEENKPNPLFIKIFYRNSSSYINTHLYLLIVMTLADRLLSKKYRHQIQ